MSTLKVNTIQDTSGADSSTPNQIQQGRAKAWVVFTGVTTTTIGDDYFVSSLTDNGTGDTTINFDSALSNANYGAFITTNGNATGTQTGGVISSSASASAPTTKTTTALRINTGLTSGGTNVDMHTVCVSIFGD